MKIKGRCSDGCLAEHDMDLTTMMCLMIEEMKRGDHGHFHTLIAMTIHIADGLCPKGFVRLAEERFDLPILFNARLLQFIKV